MLDWVRHSKERCGVSLAFQPFASLTLKSDPPWKRGLGHYVAKVKPTGRSRENQMAGALLGLRTPPGSFELCRRGRVRTSCANFTSPAPRNPVMHVSGEREGKRQSDGFLLVGRWLLKETPAPAKRKRGGRRRGFVVLGRKRHVIRHHVVTEPHSMATMRSGHPTTRRPAHSNMNMNMNMTL